jgi:tetratricopeptide (TPR) repeat protein
MAKAILTVLVIVLLNILVGCLKVDSGRAQLMPPRPKEPPGAAPVAKVAKAGEVDIVEQMAVSRRAYQQGLESLVEHYMNTGNNMKLQWAKKELAALDAIPQYNYIIEASLAGPNLKATTSIPEADDLYMEAVLLEEKAKGLIVIVDENLLRLALDKYNQLVKKYPSSDKIDDAAYRAAGIHEHFRDYTIAALYYQRASQWDPEATYASALFKAAYILDKRLHRRDEALELYRQAVENENLSYNYWTFAEKRITELTLSDESGE